MIAKLLQIMVQEHGWWWGWLEGQCAKLIFYWEKADGRLIHHTVLQDLNTSLLNAVIMYRYNTVKEPIWWHSELSSLKDGI